ncbi:MAG: SDR family oxidoreductase [Paracoccaceae bacterium]|nr:SDR family oxidoreductase [Paracoccaceae bacterium]
MARRVVITGGASGIGRTIAERFASLGDRVAICDASANNIAAFQMQMPDALTAQADVTDQDQMQVFFDQVTQHLGGVDVLVSNAGIGGPAGSIETLKLEDWRRCLSVNLDGAFLACGWAAELMRAQKSGLILLMSSSSGLFGVPNRAPYVAAKWGLVGLAKTLAMELGPAGVRVNAICPGAVEGTRMDQVLAMESDFTGRPAAEIEQQYSQGVSLRRFVSPKDIADMAVFLASDAARQITGQAMAVDGHTERMV